MSWIREIEYEDADKRLKKLYDRVKGPDGKIDNVLKVHSLRPHSLYGHMALYKNVLHNVHNTLPKWYLEVLGVYVSYLNACDYCVDHHYAGLQKLLEAEEGRAAQIKEAILQDTLDTVFDGAYRQGMIYAKSLTQSPATLEESAIQNLRDNNLDDGQILEINQVVSYFNYVNRSVLGLGVNTIGDVLGLSPKNSDEPDNWSHE